MRAVLFDLDDTLYPEHEFVESGFRAVANVIAPRYGVDVYEFYATLLRVQVLNGRGKTFDTTIRAFGIAGANIPEMVEIYREHVPSIHLFPEAEGVLAALREANVFTGIVTNGMPSVQKKKLQTLGLEKMVDVVVCAESTGFPKPHQRSFQVALRDLLIAPQHAVYVGNDPDVDFPGPKSLGMRTIHLDRLGCPGCYADWHSQRLDFVTEILNASRSLHLG